ncbi:MAG TPA: ATP-binding protein, partial [Planctomycetaceae bacterium]|nr:ATP-binding protein [Planctomycetaceae bacterium]
GHPTPDFHWELAAEAITVRIRWFGVCVGYVLVNFFSPDSNQAALNGLLALGALYALLDTLWSVRGKVFLSDLPLFVSAMEAVFIGLLCHFDAGLHSPFRFYYFLSLVVCAIRYSPKLTYSTFLLHALSYAALAFGESVRSRADLATLFLTLVMMGWVTWALIALAGLLKSAGRRLAELNARLQEHQAELEDRILQRTRELQESQALLVQQEKQAAFGLLAAGIAHEVGNPLAAISSLVQLLNRRHTDEYTRERLGMVDEQLRRIQRTLRELVDFSRPAATETTRCDVHGVIEAALSIAKYYKRKKGKRIVTRFADALPRVNAVRDQLVQVFLNLILNAMDATEEGGTIEIATGLTPAGEIAIAVRDDGCGIPAAARERIFHPYFTTKESGTGLGLFVCRKIIEQTARGRIELAESGADGTSFTVYLPPAEPFAESERESSVPRELAPAASPAAADA